MKSLYPSQPTALEQVYTDFCIIYYASVVLIKKYLLERVTQCEECSDCGDNEVKLDIIMYLSQSFIKFNSICKCAELYADYFLIRVIKGKARRWIDSCCENNYGLFMCSKSLHKLDCVVKIITGNLDKIKNAGNYSQLASTQYV